MHVTVSTPKGKKENGGGRKKRHVIVSMPKGEGGGKLWVCYKGKREMCRRGGRGVTVVKPKRGGGRGE